MTKKLTLADARKALREHGLVLDHSDGEYKVNFKGGKERTAYFTNEIGDAVATGLAMAERKLAAAAKPNATALDARSAARLVGEGTTREAFHAAVLAEAEHFVAFDCATETRRDCGSLREACEAAGQAGAARVLIYAVSAAGRSVLVIAGGKVVRP